MRRTVVRVGLVLLAITTLNGSLWALPFPRSFYEDFPLPGREWVSTLGPYDEHLVRDYGALNLALGILLVGAAVVVQRRLTQVALVAWLGYATPHFAYHTTLGHHFSTFDNVAQLSSLGLQVAVPLVLLLLSAGSRPDGERIPRSDADPLSDQGAVPDEGQAAIERAVAARRTSDGRRVR